MTEPTMHSSAAPSAPTPPSDTTLPPEPPKDATIDEIEEDIAITRERLGETIDALEGKLDVSAQAKRKVEHTKAQVADRVAQSKAQVTGRFEQTWNRATSKVSHLTARAGQTGGQVAAKATQARTQAGGSATQWTARTRANPRTVALPAAATGLALGAGLIVWQQFRSRNRS